MKAPRLICGLLIALHGAAGAALAEDISNATVPRTYPGDTLSYFYNPGPDNGGAPDRILFDDVTVPWSLPNAFFHVTRVTFKVTQKTGAGAVTITPYYSGLVPNVSYNGGANDGADHDIDNPVSFGTPQNYPANPGPSVEHTFVYGDGVHTLFNVNGSNAASTPDWRSIAIGLKFSTTNALNGWTVSESVNNLDLLWDYRNTTDFREFTYQYAGDQVNGTQYLKVEGLVLSGLDGDATIDGQVDIEDLYRLAQNWMQSGDYTMGDFNFDTQVDHVDLGILAENWQEGPALLSATLASLGLPNVVPEPATAMLLPVGLAMLMRRRNRNQV